MASGNCWVSVVASDNPPLGFASEYDKEQIMLITVVLNKLLFKCPGSEQGIHNKITN